jgi:hypothetical protein
MLRRTLVLGSLASGCFGLATAADAKNRCGPMNCLAEVELSKFAAKYQPQYQSEWCWAACISMLFSYYGHPVSQERIVKEAYGVPANIPAISGLVITSELNRTWRDDNDVEFDSSLSAAFDAQMGVAAIDNAIIVQALTDGHPLIMGAFGHATVVAAISYIPTLLGPNVTGVGVFDPWPGRGARQLTPAEMVPAPLGGALSFLALAEVKST